MHTSLQRQKDEMSPQYSSMCSVHGATLCWGAGSSASHVNGEMKRMLIFPSSCSTCVIFSHHSPLAAPSIITPSVASPSSPLPSPRAPCSTVTMVQYEIHRTMLWVLLNFKRSGRPWQRTKLLLSANQSRKYHMFWKTWEVNLNTVLTRLIGTWKSWINQVPTWHENSFMLPKLLSWMLLSTRISRCFTWSWPSACPMYVRIETEK